MLNDLQRNIHYTFKQVKHLAVALTHSSYLNENAEETAHNERLEFLGDAVLELSVSSFLYDKYPGAREGELTAMRSRMVSQPSLAALARKLALHSCLRLGKGEESQGGRTRDALLADALEAIFGAVFVDGGFAAAKGVIEALMAGNFPAAGKAADHLNAKDSKSLLQEIIQKRFQERPVYNLAGSAGPEHAKLFYVKLTLPDGKIYEDAGSSVKKAEQAAAARALKEYGA
ncbi:MAG: ribonuclease III [Deltaproteobacteria bacterium]|nr:ribonuclease III [Deltaproteobacteria bacterium]